MLEQNQKKGIMGASALLVRARTTRVERGRGVLRDHAGVYKLRMTGSFVPPFVYIIAQPAWCYVPS